MFQYSNYLLIQSKWDRSILKVIKLKNWERKNRTIARDAVLG